MSCLHAAASVFSFSERSAQRFVIAARFLTLVAANFNLLCLTFALTVVDTGLDLARNVILIHSDSPPGSSIPASAGFIR